MRAVLIVALCGLVACRADPPGSVSSPPLVVEADCSVQGEACEVAGEMCPVQGVCRDGRCVPSVHGELPSPPRASFAGNIGGLAADGTAYADDENYGALRLTPNNVREETSDVFVRLIVGRVGIGKSRGSLTALDLDTATVLWTAALNSPFLPQDSELADTGRGTIAVVTLSSGRNAQQSGVTFHRLADGQMLRRHKLEGEVIGLASDEEGRVFARLRDDQGCRLHAFTNAGASLWTRDSTCTSDRRLVTHRERLFDGAIVRDAATGDALFELDDGFSVWLASDDVLVAHAHRGIVELRDPVTFERRFRQAGAGLPFALTSRGTLLTASRDSYYEGNSCLSDCTRDVGEIREYTFDGGLIGLCDRRSDLVPFLAGGVLWLGVSNHAYDGYLAQPAPGYDLAPHGWVTVHGTPGAQRRPR